MKLLGPLCGSTLESNIIEKLSSNVPSQLIDSVLKKIQESSSNLLSEVKSSVLKEIPPPERWTKVSALAENFEEAELDIPKIQKASKGRSVVMERECYVNP